MNDAERILEMASGGTQKVFLNYQIPEQSHEIS